MAHDSMSEVDDVLDPPVDVPEEVEPELTDLLPRKYLSVSQLTLFLKCAYAWYLSYVEEKERGASARMFQGIQVHRAQEVVLLAKRETGKMPPLELATDTFADEFEKQRGLITDWEDQDPGLVKDTGVQCAKIFHQEALPKATPIMVEKTFHTVIKSADGKVKLPVFGRIDAIQVQTLTDKEYNDIREKLLPSLKQAEADKKKLPAVPKLSKPARIHDLKVTTDKWGESDIQNDLQFALYAGIEHIPDVQVDQLVKGRAKVPRPRYEQLNYVMSNREVSHAVKVTEGVAKSIGLGHFPLTDPGNWWCSPRWCSMWPHCRGK